MSVLARILEAKRGRLAAGLPFPAGAPGAQPDGARFERALAEGGGTRVIAEIKHRSPSAGILLEDAGARLERVAHAYRRGGAAALSIVTEQDFFGGDPLWIPRARAAGLPILMKDFVVDDRQLDLARALGADAVLLIVAALTDERLGALHEAALERGLAVLVEAHTEDEARRALAAGARLIGINARDLATFEVDLALSARLGAALPRDVLRVAESGIARRDEVETLSGAFDAFLVGGSLLRSDDPCRALRELRGENATEVKICGLTREEDLEACREAGVDYVGLNLSPRSPRGLERGRAAELARAAAFARGVVAVFAGNEASEVQEAVEALRPDVVQLTDPPTFDPRPSTFDAKVWQTVRVGRDDLGEAMGWPGDALLFDTAVGGVSGGTGRSFDWSLLAALPRVRPWVLAGGLDAGNVARALASVRPDVVDVASGVESAPGIKDPARIAAFVREVRGAALSSAAPAEVR